MAITASVDDPEAATARRMEQIERQAREDRAAVAATVRPIVSDLADTIQNTLATNYYTKPQTDAKVANPGNINPGNVNASGGVSAAGTIYSAAALDANVVKARTGPTTNITASRVSAWLQNSDGTLGTASSSERFKTNIRPAGLDVEAILGLETVLYQYRAEIAKRDDPESEGYVGPDYHVATEVGVIAERLHEAGLWQFVVYERDPETGAAVRDEAGHAIPFSVHYELLALALLPVAQHQAAQIAAQAAQLAALDARLTALESKD